MLERIELLLMLGYNVTFNNKGNFYEIVLTEENNNANTGNVWLPKSRYDLQTIMQYTGHIYNDLTNTKTF